MERWRFHDRWLLGVSMSRPVALSAGGGAALVLQPQKLSEDGYDILLTYNTIDTAEMIVQEIRSAGWDLAIKDVLIREVGYLQSTRGWRVVSVPILNHRS